MGSTVQMTWGLGFAWASFFGTTVFGHVGMKFAAQRMVEGPLKAQVIGLALDPWTISGVLSWTISSLLWVGLLVKYPLFEASSIATLRYVLVLAASWLALREHIEPKQLIGMGLIMAGVLLVSGK